MADEKIVLSSEQTEIALLILMRFHYDNPKTPASLEQVIDFLFEYINSLPDEQPLVLEVGEMAERFSFAIL